jgi:hypothetical protein
MRYAIFLLLLSCNGEQPEQREQREQREQGVDSTVWATVILDMKVGDTCFVYLGTGKSAICSGVIRARWEDLVYLDYNDTCDGIWPEHQPYRDGWVRATFVNPVKWNLH